MIRLYILLCLLPCLLLTAPFAHAALLPRLKATFNLPGAVFTEPETRSLKVVPFKELPGQSHHGHRLHHTLSLVKRLVEDQGDMVEVTEEALEELLEQINKLHDQVNGMMPSGAPDRQPSRETGASSNGQSAGSSDGSSSDGQPKQLPGQPAEAKVSDPEDAPGPSEVPIVSEPSLRPELPAPTDDADAVREPQPPNSPEQSSVPGQSRIEGLDRQAKSALAPAAANPTQAANDKPTNPPSEAEPEVPPGDGAAVALTESADASENGEALQSDNLPNNAVAQPSGDSQAPSGTQVNTAEDVKPTEEPQDEDSSPVPSDTDAGQSSALPGGAFIESPDGILQTLSNGVTPTEQPGDPAPEETQESSPPDDECAENEVSGLPGTIRNSNCTPGNRPFTSDPAQDASANPSLVATAETSLAQIAATASELASQEPIKGDSPVATQVKGQAPALETEATSTPTINVVDSQQLAAPTLIASPPVASNLEPSTVMQLSVEKTSPILRTLVFTSVITKSSTIKITTTRTEFVDANEPTRSFKAPGHVFKEDEDAGATFNKDGKLAVEDSDDDNTPETPLQGTSLGTEITPETASPSTTIMAMTTTISLSYRSTMPTPEATQNLVPALVPSAIIRGNGTDDTTPTSGFKTVRSTASLAERALI
ncbi:hypothetical protein FPOAC2_03293 [Fusarium poae]|jgi:hypothetical protein|uniref:Uncharacterized protein n=1 Tax=Fusarium poae TaxID=36050 RepID=A0A1B8B8Q6_FUSPO|nr:hypothetical protein FPOA_03029 [Fusarium poae]